MPKKICYIPNRSLPRNFSLRDLGRISTYIDQDIEFKVGAIHRSTVDRDKLLFMSRSVTSTYNALRLIDFSGAGTSIAGQIAVLIKLLRQLSRIVSRIPILGRRLKRRIDILIIGLIAIEASILLFQPILADIDGLKTTKDFLESVSAIIINNRALGK